MNLYSKNVVDLNFLVTACFPLLSLNQIVFQNFIKKIREMLPFRHYSWTNKFVNTMVKCRKHIKMSLKLQFLTVHLIKFLNTF